MERLEDRWCPSGDTYKWNPPANPPDYNASDPANWMKLVDGVYVQQDKNGTIPGQNGNSSGDTVILDGNSSNMKIVWDQSFDFSTLNIQNNYTGVQTINKNVTLELNGLTGVNNKYYSLYSLSNQLQVNFVDNTGKLQIDYNSVISAFNITGNGTVLLDSGGKTYICDGSFNATSQLSGTLQVIDATLIDQGQTQIQLTGNNSTIQVQCSASMQVNGSGKTLISEQFAGSNDYIDVQNSGLLYYTGKGGQDIFTAPVLVEQYGTFTADGGAGGSILEIDGAEAGTNKASLYVSGTLQLQNNITLILGSGFYADATSAINTDNLTETINVMAGQSCTMNGTVTIDTQQFTYAKLRVLCDNLSFGGTLIAHVSGPNNGTCDQLIVTGKMTLDPKLSKLDAPVDGPADLSGESWTIISTTKGINNNFSYVYPVNSEHPKYNPGDNDYIMLYGYAQ